MHNPKYGGRGGAPPVGFPVHGAAGATTPTGATTTTTPSATTTTTTPSATTNHPPARSAARQPTEEEL